MIWAIAVLVLQMSEYQAAVPDAIVFVTAYSFIRGIVFVQHSNQNPLLFVN